MLVCFIFQSERNFIMEVVCEATQSQDTQVRVAALQCLVKIMTLYYQYMEPYMGQALFPVSNGCKGLMYLVFEVTFLQLKCFSR